MPTDASVMLTEEGGATKLLISSFVAPPVLCILNATNYLNPKRTGNRKATIPVQMK